MKPYYETAFDRHYEDLKKAKSHLRFNEKLGKRYITIIESLQHYKGELAGKELKLEMWQKKLILIAFGWERLSSEGKWIRRFSTVFIFIPRKNGKTILASGIAIADMIIRGETGGEVVIFATKRDQAKLAWTGCDKMIHKHKELKSYSKTAYSKIQFSKNDTTITTLGRDSDTEDGLNVSIGIADEYHAHPDNSLWEVVESSQGARQQPLMLAITTAGTNTASPAYYMYEYAKKILSGAINNDNFFAFVSEPDEKDDPFKEETWIKANPNYGISVKRDYMRKVSKEAEDRPELKNNFLVKNLNVWTNQAESFISFEKWKRSAGELPEFDNFVLGIDASLRDDFTALVKVKKVKDIYYVKPRFYIPEIYATKERERELNAPLLAWISEGHIEVIPQSEIDSRYLKRDILTDIGIIEAIPYDPHRMRKLVIELEEEGYENCMPISQNYTIAAPTNHLMRQINEGKVIHDNNPVMNWMISNMTIKSDINGNIRPQKSDPNRKIDGVAALINTMAYFDFTAKEETEEFAYEDRGFRFI